MCTRLLRAAPVLRSLRITMLVWISQTPLSPSPQPRVMILELSSDGDGWAPCLGDCNDEDDYGDQNQLFDAIASTVGRTSDRPELYDNLNQSDLLPEYFFRNAFLKVSGAQKSICDIHKYLLIIYIIQVISNILTSYFFRQLKIQVKIKRRQLKEKN